MAMVVALCSITSLWYHLSMVSPLYGITSLWYHLCGSASIACLSAGRRRLGAVCNDLLRHPRHVSSPAEGLPSAPLPRTRPPRHTSGTDWGRRHLSDGSGQEETRGARERRGERGGVEWSGEWRTGKKSEEGEER